MKLNLACGQRSVEGFLGVDVVPGEHVDIVHDLLDFPWPWDDSSIEAAFSSHFLEHIGHEEGRDLIAFMNELWRVLEPGGTVEIVVPYGFSNRGLQDPTHKRYIVPETFAYFDQNWLKEQGLDHYPITCDFEQVAMVGHFNAPWDLRSDESRQFGVQHYVNVLADLQVTLRARKT